MKKYLTLLIIIIIFNLANPSFLLEDIKSLGIYEKKVLVIQSYNRDYSHTRELETGIELIFQESSYVTCLLYEFLDTKKYFSPEYFETQRDIFMEKYSQLYIDGIILCDDDALNFYMAYGDEIFGDNIPVVATGINSIRKFEKNHPGIFIIEERPDYEKNIDLALSQNKEKGIDTLNFIYDITTTSYEIFGDLQILLNDKYSDFEHKHFLEKTPEEIKALVENSSQNEIFFLTVYSKSKDGRAYIHDEFPKYISENSINPIYCFWEFYLDSGVLGGYLASSIKYGEAAANTMIDLWNGEFVTPIIYEAGLNHGYIFDYNVAKKYKLTDFPENSLFINKPPTFWEENKLYLVASAVIFSLLTIIIILQYHNTKSHQRESFLLKHNEEIQKQLEKKLLQSDKMNAIGQLAGGIAHDFNNQLMGISGLTTLMLAQCDNAHRMHLQKILHQTQIASELVNKLLTFSNQNIHFEKYIHVQSTLIHAIESLNHIEYKKIVIERNFEKQGCYILGDEAFIESAFLNVIKNACEAVNLDGRIIIKMYVKQLESEDLVSFFQEMETGEYCLVEIIDTGSGVSEDEISKWFEPFYTTKPFGEGHGMGLSAVYGTIAKHKGGIKVKSQLGKGTTFTIALPLAKKVNIDKNKKIVILDDDEIVSELIEAVLMGNGYSNVTLLSRISKLNFNDVNLLITDKNIHSSFEKFIEASLNENKELSIIGVSGYFTEKDYKLILKHKNLSLLSKPIETKLLLQTIERLF